MRARQLKSILLCALFTLSLGCLSPKPPESCVTGSGVIAMKTFEADEFDSINFTGSGTIYLTQDLASSIRIEAEENVLELLNARVEDGVLSLSSTRCFIGTKPLNVYAAMNDVKQLSAGGSAKIEGQNTIKADELAVIASGSGLVELSLNVGVLATSLSGSSASVLKGSARSHDALVYDSARLDAFNLSTDSTRLTVNGSGAASVDASDELVVSVSDSGIVYHLGDARVVQNVSGSGVVVDQGAAASDEKYCVADSDCACGVHVSSGDCFFGNKDFVDSTKQCPDFCTGIGGNLEIKCVNSECVQATP